jgi:hypothetical protein
MRQRIGERAGQAVERDDAGEAPPAGLAQRQQALDGSADIRVGEVIVVQLLDPQAIVLG